MANSQMQKLTPVLFVDAIEPCLAFWQRLGFARAAEVPEADGDGNGAVLGFVVLAKDSVEVMYQSRKSVEKDVPALAAMPSSTALYIHVTDLDAVVAQLGDAPLVIARRRTFYGAEEVGVRAPCGNVVTFSQVA